MAVDPQTIEIFVRGLDADGEELARCERLLSADERDRAGRFRRLQDYQRFVVARGFLRRTLGRRLNVAPEEVRFAYGAFGKPRLADDRAAPSCEFNLSHSEDLAVIAVSHGHSVGVDIEHIRPLTDTLRLAARYLPHEEASRLRRLPPEQRDAEFLVAWTRLESRLKARGSTVFAAAAERDDTERDVNVGWTTRTLRLPAPFVGAVTVQGDECLLDYDASGERSSFPAAESAAAGTNSISLGR